MRKILIAALAVVLICCGASECSEMLSGVEDVRVEYIKTDYQVLNVSSAIAVEYSSDSDMMEITADRDMFPYIDVKRTGNILELKVRQNPFKNTGRIRVVLPVSGNLRWIDLRLLNCRCPEHRSSMPKSRRKSCRWMLLERRH